ncbi:MAG: FecR domain-containing protein [Pseudomonadota bacterium]
MSSKNSAAENAQRWMQALDDNPTDERLADEFLTWLSASAENAVAWGQLSRLSAYGQVAQPLQAASSIDEAGQDFGSAQSITKAETQVEERLRQQPHLQATIETGSNVRQTTRRAGRGLRKGYLGLAIAAVILAMIFLPDVYRAIGADHVTWKGEMKQVSLPDGSVAHLAAETALAVDFRENRRHVDLRYGMAFFDVKDDPARPFSVRANALHARVIGTSFEMRTTYDGAEVSVLTGQVDASVDEGEAAPSTPDRGATSLNGDTNLAPTTVRLSAGDQIRLREDGTLGTKRRLSSLDKVAGWRSGTLIVEDWPVAEVIDALASHYGGVMINLPSSAGNERISGVYALSDPVASLRLVAATQGRLVRQVSPWITVISDE